MVTALLLIGFVCVCIALHPFVTYPISLWYLRWMKGAPHRRVVATDPPLRFSICMCAYNEERVIDEKMRNLLALRTREPNLAIHVYVDAASDRTAELLSKYADEIDLHVAAE